ncbi:MAG: hypothetical protein ABSE84_22050, partial [Isosphaeraceae bacterium]
NVAVHNSKDSWVNSRRCQIGTYDTDFVSAAKRQHPELTGSGAGNLPVTPDPGFPIKEHHRTQLL